jgi:hypothetical protein
VDRGAARAAALRRRVAAQAREIADLRRLLHAAELEARAGPADAGPARAAQAAAR